ncbi:MAG: alkaline phosphatase [Chitinophagaceae bacterium]|nr:MAG: alkaline phosphatase [Chitinophagaceae bacterium]
MIGDGMGTAQIFAGLTANKGKLNLERCTAIGFHKSQSADQYVTDSGAGATAFSTGSKTNNGSIGVDATAVAKPTILEIAESHNLATGMVVTCAITHATPASFIAHQTSRALGEEIATDFLKTDIDVFIGGGKNHFNKRKDGKNLLDSLRKRNYQVVESFPEIGNISSGKLAGFIADAQPSRMIDGRGPQLLQNTQTAINILNKNKNGFFLMVEGSQIDWGAHANDPAYLTSELIDFDKAVGAAIDFAERDKNTLVIITGDHETGGLSLVNGDMKAGTIEAKFATDGHTGVMIPVFAYGPGAERFIGIYENTSIFHKILQGFGFQH